jgi:diaminohydroxyphosphoribosylaminopyrimidine deaminase / 5-amino-6-(5-phosphoribosylamino)uracil reductase
MLLGFRRTFSFDPSSIQSVIAVYNGSGIDYYTDNLSPELPGVFSVALTFNPQPVYSRDVTVFSLHSDLTASLIQAGNLNPEEIGFLLPFLSLCAMAVYAFNRKRAISILHLAQSLDGRMATITHSSKWISNTENLTYAHQMRALSDAILIGSNTLIHDQPALTVRYVEGPNPVKVIVGDSAIDFTSVLKSGDRVIHFVSHPAEECKGVETIMLRGNSKHIPPAGILRELYRQGLHSVYIEGGAFTLSEFIREGAADQINFYIAPVILGSGISIEVKGIVRVEDAISLCNCNYTRMGDGMLVTGSIKTRGT